MNMEDTTILRRGLMRAALLLPLAAGLAARAGASIDPHEATGDAAAAAESADERKPCPKSAEAAASGDEGAEDLRPCGKTAKKRPIVPAETNAAGPAGPTPAEIATEQVAAGVETTAVMKPKLASYENSFPTGQANALGDAPILNGSVAMPSVPPAGYRNPRRRMGDPLAGNAEPPAPGAPVRLAQDVTSLGRTGSVYMRSPLGNVKVGDYQFERNKIGDAAVTVRGKSFQFKAINDQRMMVNGTEMKGQLSPDKKSGHFTSPDGKEASFAPSDGGVVVNGYLFKP